VLRIGYSQRTLGEKVLLRAGGSPRQSQSANVETLAAPASSPAPIAAGRVPAFANGAIVAGKYLVEETIAEGGIGVVVVARHLALQQRVAIKYLKAKTLGNPTLVERFVREARLAAQLTSEHVVRVYDVGTLPEAGPYMVMEYLVGEDLGQTVQSGPVPIPSAVDYILQACDALAEAHALRIVHRDIKPENLFLAQRASATPVLKIIDFGISKVAPKRGDEGHWGTQTGASERFGTPLYMSPEQLRSTSSVDARTDIWSLGVVLHELLTGALPFPGADLPQVCTSVLTAPPARLTSLRPDAPAALEAVLLRCLEKEPTRRYRNVAELAQELAPFGPPSALDRAARIAEVVRRAGESVRPPTPTPGAVSLRPAIASKDDAAPRSDPRAVTTVHLRPGRGAGRAALLAAVAGIVCAAALVGVAVRLGAAQAIAQPSASLPPVPSRVTQAAAARPVPTEATHNADPSAPQEIAIEAIPPAASISSTGAQSHPRPAARPHAAPGAASAPRASSGVAAGAGDSRRAQFGERE
jgi:serine/threonine-protein kinase